MELEEIIESLTDYEVRIHVEMLRCAIELYFPARTYQHSFYTKGRGFASFVPPTLLTV